MLILKRSLRPHQAQQTKIGKDVFRYRSENCSDHFHEQYYNGRTRTFLGASM